MSGSERNSPPSPLTSNDRRRSSFAGQFVDLFGRQSSASGAIASSPMNGGTFPGSITEAAAQAQRRRLSLTTIGLSATAGQGSPFSPGRPRTESLSSANSGSVDESPFEDSDGPGSSSLPPTPFGRRLSFGARALRDVRTGSVSVSGNGNGNGNPRPSVSKARTPPTAKSHGRGLSSFSSLRSSDVSEYPSLTSSSTATGGFDFAESFKSRAERSSVSAASGSASLQTTPTHQRAKSVTTEPPTQPMPKQPKVPDAIQERMLRGDFYMD